MRSCILTVVSIVLFSSAAFGASFVVNNNGDTNDANLTDNLCADSAGNCTLRAAVQQANALSSGDVIAFASGLQTITLTIETEITIENAGTLQINGPGANVLSVNGGAGVNRIFTANNAVATIAGVTLTEGGTTNPFGSSQGNGGAILTNGGSLTIERVYFNANYAGNGGPPSGTSGAGGGVYFNGGTHSIQNSTFANNRANGGGGAVFNNSNTNLTIVNSTISENTGHFQGGGIYNAGNLTLRNATIANNFATKASGIFNLGYGGGVANVGGTLEFNNTIIAGNTVQNTTQQPSAQEIYFSGGTIISTGNNFIVDSEVDSTTK